MLSSLSRLSLACTLALAASLPAKAADHPDACPISHVAPLVLPRVKEALDHNSELTIVAFGSS